MRILCIETSSDACSVAINYKDTFLEYYELAPCKHSKIILPMIQKLLAESGSSLNQVDAIAFGCGPGSFTGIRLAASIVQGLALGLDLPAIPVSTLNIMSQGVEEQYNVSKILVGLDAKMGGIYLGAYYLDSDGLMQPFFTDKLVFKFDQVFANDNMQGADWFCVGDIWQNVDVYKDFLAQKHKVIGIVDKFYPQAKHIIPIAKKRFQCGEMVCADVALPVYLREQVAYVQQA